MIEKKKRTYPNRHRRHPPAETMYLEPAHYDVLKILARYRFMGPSEILQLMPKVKQKINPNTLQRKGERAMTPETLAIWEKAEKEVTTTKRGKESVYLKVEKPVHPQTMQKYLRTMYNNGFIVRRPRMKNGWLYSLGTTGAKELETKHDVVEASLVEPEKDYDRFNLEPGSQHLAHTRLIARVRMALNLATPTEEADYDDDKYWQYENKKLSAEVYVEGAAEFKVVNPDGFFRIKTPAGILSFLLEVVRNNPERKTLLPKLKAYAIGQSEFKDLLKISGFRVVILTTSEERRDNIVRMIQNGFKDEGSGWLFLVGTEYNANPHARVVESKRCFDLARPESVLEPIWRCGTDQCTRWHSLVE